MITPTGAQIHRAYQECLAYFKRPGAIKTSVRSLKSGGKAEWFFDVDPLLNDPVGCRNATFLYVECLEKLARQQRVDCFASIEKAGGGTVGAIRLAGAVSIYSGIPNVVIRLDKKIVTEQIKLPPVDGRPGKEQLQGAKIVIITDHSTTATEILKAVQVVKRNGGEVTDVIAYSTIPSELRKQELEAQGINIHSLYELPRDARSVGIGIE